MIALLTKRSVDLSSAALRHVRDAVHLAAASTFQHRSLDQAYHLAGFGPECARKACLPFAWLDKVIGHRLSDLSEKAVDLACSLDPAAGRYQLSAWRARFPALAEWKEDARYERTGTFPEKRVDDVVREAREAVDAIIVQLWADGRFPDNTNPW